MIIEKPVANIDDKPINVKKKNVPQSTNNSLPLLFNTQLYIGSKGTGKSYKLTKLLQLYEKSKIKDEDGTEYEMRTVLICPTAQSGANEVYKTLNSLDQESDIHLEYSDDLVLKILDDIKAKQAEYDEYLEYKKIYTKFLKLKSVDKLETDELEALEQHEYMTPKDVFGEIKPKVNFLIFDDLIGMGCFNKKAKSVLSNLVIKHRHLKTNLIFTTQSFKQIPPVIRTNIDIYCIFKSSSYNEILNKIFEDINGFVRIEEFIELYEHATDEKNDCLTIVNNSMDKRGVRFYKNWNIELFLK
jgi:Poxvirus A32 protein